MEKCNGRKARIVDLAAVPRRVLGIFHFIRTPRGGDVCKGSFHGKITPFRFLSGIKTARAGRLLSGRAASVHVVIDQR